MCAIERVAQPWRCVHLQHVCLHVTAERILMHHYCVIAVVLLLHREGILILLLDSIPATHWSERQAHEVQQLRMRAATALWNHLLQQVHLQVQIVMQKPAI